MIEKLDNLMASKWVAFIFGCLNGFFGINGFVNGSYFWGILCIFLSLYCFRAFFDRG